MLTAVKTFQKPQMQPVDDRDDAFIVFEHMGHRGQYCYDVRIERRKPVATLLGAVEYAGGCWIITHVGKEPIPSAESDYYESSADAADWLYEQWLAEKRKKVRQALFS